MKPRRFSPAHHSPNLAELVCSNSLRGAGMNNAVGCLKEELRRCGSLFMEAADATAVPAGGALAVDRDRFSAYLTRTDRFAPPDRVAPGGGDGDPRRGNGDCRLGAADLRAPLDRHRPSDRQRTSLFLRRHRPHRRGRLHRLLQGLEGVALRQGGGRLRQLPPRQGAVPRLRRRTARRGEGPGARLRKDRSISRGACRSRRWPSAAK